MSINNPMFVVFRDFLLPYLSPGRQSPARKCTRIEPVTQEWPTTRHWNSWYQALMWSELGQPQSKKCWLAQEPGHYTIVRTQSGRMNGA